MPTERRQKKSESKRTGEQRNFNQRMTIAIVGAGRLGTALGIALARRGHLIEAVVARSLSHARRALPASGRSTADGSTLLRVLFPISTGRRPAAYTALAGRCDAARLSGAPSYAHALGSFSGAVSLCAHHS